MDKLKEINNSNNGDSKSKAQQYLDGLLRIPFGIYKKEVIRVKFEELKSKYEKNVVHLINTIKELEEQSSLSDDDLNNTASLLQILSDFENREQEPFTKSEKLFINKLVDTLNEEYRSANYIDWSIFQLSMGDMGETTHILSILKFTDEFYGVEYQNYIDSDDDRIISECDGFDCLKKLLINIIDKINKDYDYEGNT
jgi:hypothetical protein